MFFVFSVVCFYSCKQSSSNESKDNVKIININVGDTAKPFFLSQIAQDISLIYLETDSLSYFDYIQDFRQFDKKFYFVTAKRTVLLIFTENGKLVKRIDLVGKGPREYSTIDSYTIDQEKKRLVIYDASLRKFISFSLNGEFISSRSTAWFGSEVV